MPNPSDFDLKERVRAAVDIVDVIGAGLELRPQGRNFVARCPWHDDRRPSMTVNPSRQSWKCWVCDLGGDVFSFVMQRDGVDFPTAVRQLAEVAGIEVPEFRRGPKTQPGNPDDRETLQEVLRHTVDAYHQCLVRPSSEDAQIAADYLRERGIDDAMRDKFGIGFAPDQWSWMLDRLMANAQGNQSRKFRGEVIAAAGVASPKRSGNGFVDMFRGRLMFPIWDLQGRPVAMGGRVIPQIAARHGDNAGGKYINGRETLLFKKSETLYALHHARDAIRKQNLALVMEGYTDVIAAHAAGIETAVAVLGTALTPAHIKMLRRFTDRVVLVLDGDEAGRKRADEVLENFVSSDVDLRILTLPDDSDPADFLAKHGATELSEQVKSAPDALDHKLDRLTAQIDPRRDSHAVAKAADQMLKILAAAPDGLKIDQILLRMADRLHFDTARLRRRLEHFRQQRTLFSRNKRPAAGPRQYANPPSDPNAAFDIAVQADDAFSGPTGSDGITGSSGTLGPFHAMAPLQTGAPTHAHSPEHFFDPPHAGVPAAPQLTPLRGIDLECFEIIFSDLDLAATSVETIDPEWLDSITAKMLFSALQGLELAGHELSGQAVMTLIENQELKNHLSSVLDRIDSDSSPGDETPQQRYAALMQRFAQRQWRRQQDQVAAQLESAELDETAELEALQRLFEQERQRQLERKT